MPSIGSVAGFCGYEYQQRKLYVYVAFKIGACYNYQVRGEYFYLIICHYLRRITMMCVWTISPYCYFPYCLISKF